MIIEKFPVLSNNALLPYILILISHQIFIYYPKLQ